MKTLLTCGYCMWATFGLDPASLEAVITKSIFSPEISGGFSLFQLSHYPFQHHAAVKNLNVRAGEVTMQPKHFQSVETMSTTCVQSLSPTRHV